MVTRVVREATADDGAACAAIYAPYVTDTVITFENDPPGAEEMAGRIEAALETHTWLVLEDDGEIRGYAYARAFHPRAAYRWACELTVFAELGRRRTGAGRALYTELLERMAGRGFATAVALITVPNEASIGLHHALGFEDAGLLRNVGYKLGAWYDVAYLQRPLADPGDPPAEPR